MRRVRGGCRPSGCRGLQGLHRSVRPAIGQFARNKPEELEALPPNFVEAITSL
jgi:hypothetical protein